MLEFNFPIAIFTVVCFLAMIFVLNKRLYQPLLAHMDERERLIKGADDGADSAASEIAALTAQREKILADASQQAAQIRAQASAQARAKADELVAAEAAKIAAEQAEFDKALAKEQKQLTAELLAKMPDFKAALAKKMAQI